MRNQFKAHKSNLALRTLPPNDHVILRRYGSKQIWENRKIEDRHTD